MFLKVHKMSLIGGKYMLVSREYWEPDFYEDFFEIVKLCKQSGGVVALVFALHSIDEKKLHRISFRVKLKQATCDGLKILFETSDLKDTRQNNTQVMILNGALKLFYQWFSKSSDPILHKEALIADLPARMLDQETLIIVCGEISALTVNHNDKSTRDDFELLPWLNNKKVKVIINAAHDEFLRWEMPLKKKELSKQNRLVLSVWNANRKKRNSKVPWSAYHDGVNVTEKIVELQNHGLRKDIRIGLFDRNELFIKGKL